MEKVAVVFGLEASAKITVPGPLNAPGDLECSVRQPIIHSNSVQDCGLGKAMIWSGPAFTKGG
jgi:hypothetical protein